ncbi:unnamed protein product [Rhizoctonia solani]|uniref:BTB domain-containing protein n=1 Tax=Rhizoctonia solani TaxID=456999 RepID=A0A8H3CNB0_9AGAM|nr:unnamed protein product [Rhizoctonia solani]
MEFHRFADGNITGKRNLVIPTCASRWVMELDPNNAQIFAGQGSITIMATRHSTFYFDETLVVLKVENVLFKVHKYHLLQSETFSDMFKVPQTGDSIEGATPETPIVLNGVVAADFEALLTVLYARRCSNVQLTLASPMIVSAFRLAHMWNFSDLRAYLLAQAEETLSDAEKIDFAKKFGIQNWLVPAYLNLCRRSTPPTTDEATKLGLDDVLMVFRLREQYRAWDPIWASSSNPDSAEKFCDRCFGFSYHSPSFGATSSPFTFAPPSQPIPSIASSSTHKCSVCDKDTRSYFRRNRLAELNNTEQSLEKRLEMWVEGGCEPE